MSLYRRSAPVPAVAAIGVLLLGSVSCGKSSGKSQPPANAPSPEPTNESGQPRSGSPDSAAGPQLVGPSNKDVKFVLAQVVRSSLPSNSRSNSVALFSISAVPIDSKDNGIKLIVEGEVVLEGPGVKTITELQSLSFANALQIFSQGLSPTAIEAITNKVNPNQNTIGVLVRMPRFMPDAATELNSADFCDGEPRKVYVKIASEPRGLSGTALFEWSGKRTADGLCELTMDMSGFGNFGLDP